MEDELTTLIQNIRSNFENNNTENMEQNIDTCINEIMKNKFFPLLKSLFEIKLKIENNQNKEIFILYLLLNLSHRLLDSNQKMLYSSFIEKVDALDEDVDVRVPNKFLSLLPFSIDVSSSGIIKDGGNLDLSVSINSYLPGDLIVDSFDIIYENPDETSDKFSFDSKTIKKNRNIFNKTFTFNVFTSYILVKHIVFHIKKLHIIVPLEDKFMIFCFGAGLFNINIKPTDVFLVDEKAAIEFEICVGNIKIDRMYIDIDTKYEICGDIMGKDISKENEIVDVTSNSCLKFCLFVKSSEESIDNVDITFSFDKDKKGSKIKKVVEAKFVREFDVKFLYFDNNYVKIDDSNLSNAVLTEIQVSNLVSKPFILNKITKNGSEICNPLLPVELSPNEIFCAQTEVKAPCEYKYEFFYNIFGKDLSASFTQVLDYKESEVSIRFDHPEHIKVDSEFELIINLTTKIEEYLILEIDNKNIKDLFVSGKRFYKFKPKDISSFKVTCICINTGRVALPTVTIRDCKNRILLESNSFLFVKMSD